MIDPERLLETNLQDAASLRERELLGSLKPSGDAQAAVWRHVVGQGVLVVGAAATAATTAATASAASASAASAEVVAASASTALSTGTATGASTVATTTGVMSSLAVKAGVALIVAAPVLGGTVYLTRGAAQRDQAAATTARIEASSQTPQVRSAVTEAFAPSKREAEVAVVPAPDPTKLTTNSAPLPTNADALREENRLLREARSLERSGNPGQALRILNDLDRSFVRGALLQEREILRIQSLSATGSTAAAKTRAEQFLKRYPASPYTAHVRSILDGSSP